VNRKSSLVLFALSSAAFSGCLSAALERNTLSHAESSADLRYREVVENLAMIYANRDALPSYSSIYAGTTDMQDNVQPSASTSWMRNAANAVLFSQQVLDIPATRQLTENWSLDPTIVPEKLVAMRAACQWVLFGPDSLGPNGLCLWSYDPNDPAFPKYPPTYYFGVANRLANLQANHGAWLHCSTCRKDVPRKACYWAGCQGKYVWIEADGVAGLSEFTLIFQSIARFDVLHAGPQPGAKTRMVKVENPNVYQGWMTTPDGPTHYTPYAPIVKSITLYVDADGIPTPGANQSYLPTKRRTDNVGQDAKIQSALAASAKSP
jgi:hypothetical protein